ncbi:hypothetical protein RclHR1_16840004 [Rhizophagus clarus]|uniref:Uncharacterized protein n=1 Tax=Rhizophagus clarus TaxID=94130 RepID=A0A2Z6QIH7_9GLOM|nr:hypothetical protein RclHR1_16840004 [Rhizophagus clarus]GES86408.1 hypothetical protein GLOIN_2v1848404 [Rhizophagus clarus]
MISPPKYKSIKKNPDKNKSVKRSNENFQAEENELKQIKVDVTDTLTGEILLMKERTVIYRIILNSKSERLLCNNLPGGIVIFVHNNDDDFHCVIFLTQVEFVRKYLLMI